MVWTPGWHRSERPRLPLITALLCLLTGQAAPAIEQAAQPLAESHRMADYDYFVAGDPAAPRASHTDFLLALMGGHNPVDSAFSAIARAAGNGHIVILRAAQPSEPFDARDGEYGASFVSRWGPARSAQTLTFRSRSASFDPQVLQILRGADGIFIAGGDQGNYVRYWKGTPVETALNEHVRLGRPIGGTSAGLAILGRYSYPCLDGMSLESRIALSDPANPTVAVEADFLHLEGLEHVITDSHFSQRARLGRLIVLLSRIRSERGEPGAYGLGIDEGTALLVTGSGEARIAQGSAGSAWVVSTPESLPARIARGLTAEGITVSRLDARSILETRSGAVRRPAALAHIDVYDGIATIDPLTASIMLREHVPPDET